MYKKNMYKKICIKNRKYKYKNYNYIKLINVYSVHFVQQVKD